MEGDIDHPPRQFSANVILINSLGKEWPGSCNLCLPITDMQECSGPMAWVRIFFFCIIMHGLSYFKHIWHKVSLQSLFFLMLKLFHVNLASKTWLLWSSDMILVVLGSILAFLYKQYITGSLCKFSASASGYFSQKPFIERCYLETINWVLGVLVATG